ALVVQAEVEADNLFLVTDTQAHHHIDHFENDVGEDGGIDHGEDHAFSLDPQLGGDAFDFTEAAQQRGGKGASEDRADDAADAVHAEHIQRVVIAQLALQAS